ncbi:hypothetical protein JTB14_020210 [Gonioctena quinquepunctata]|nr:hypothetical protein JTB14_020210 [Gonioctena quinquepunctata]
MDLEVLHFPTKNLRTDNRISLELEEEHNEGNKENINKWEEQLSKSAMKKMKEIEEPYRNEELKLLPGNGKEQRT